MTFQDMRNTVSCKNSKMVALADVELTRSASGKRE